ncbi:HK97 family phage major capsid protein [Sphingomonas jinjuensis]|uniref:HK97 family phage major capsid protein n=1 Tax=Sphingomonas jinjuensis TaxID=535907 RepID=A0A840F537_9SPHN|nr:phage major capsid protein [Sphingomonas jinjuensis]MBB4152909.1 HK97 family phage major capsid protein [Sphingomonas jinjuensis]
MLTQLHEQRGRLVTQAREALDEINKNTDDARAAELETRHDTIMGELDALDGKITREERMATAERKDEERRERQRPRGDDAEHRGSDGDGDDDRDVGGERAQAEYRGAFLAMLAEGGDVSALAPEQRTLLRRGFVENRTQVAGTPAAGGYTVPRTLAGKIIEVMKDWGPMYDPGITDEMTTSGGNPYDLPTNDDTANTSAPLNEGADLVDDNSGDLTFGQLTIGAYVFATPWLKVSFELLQDSAFNVEEFIARKLGERLGRGANAKLTVGTGAGQPQGIVVAAPVGITAASATAIASDELIGLQHSVNQAYRRSPKCRWMFADTSLAALRKLKDGQGNYLWQLGDIRANAPDVILGKPYSVNDDTPGIATGNKSVLFGDFSRYTVRKVGSPLIGTVRERFWPKIGMAGLIRYDGRLLDGAAIKALKQA